MHILRNLYSVPHRRALNLFTRSFGIMNSISVEQIDEFRKDFISDKTAKVAQNAVTNVPINDVVLNRDVISNTNFTFNIQLDDWSVTNQKSSGRCWLFAMLNLFRVDTAKKLNVKEFEFSQSYIHFWDKFERANHFLEAMIELKDRDADDRTMNWLLHDPIGDGGQWSMGINLIRKHGLVPKEIFPESKSSSGTLHMNGVLKDILRTSACEIRHLLSTGDVEEAKIYKVNRMKDIFRVLSIHLGTPPPEFEWSWKDKDKNVKSTGKITPLEFLKEYVTIDYEDYVCIVHDPRNPTMKTYTVDYLQSVAGGPKLIYLNVDVEVMKDLTKRQLEDGLPVWMGCDVGKQFYRVGGIWDISVYEHQQLYGVNYGMDKANRLRHNQTLMTHAMMFTGVHVVDNAPTKWRVENSWGDANGKKGFYCMNDNWFNEHMFEIATPKAYLTPTMIEALAIEPIVLPAWDPMGSLAC